MFEMVTVGVQVDAAVLRVRYSDRSNALRRGRIDGLGDLASTHDEQRTVYCSISLSSRDKVLLLTSPLASTGKATRGKVIGPRGRERFTSRSCLIES